MVLIVRAILSYLLIALVAAGPCIGRSLPVVSSTAAQPIVHSDSYSHSIAARSSMKCCTGLRRASCCMCGKCGMQCCMMSSSGSHAACTCGDCRSVPPVANTTALRMAALPSRSVLHARVRLCTPSALPYLASKNDFAFASLSISPDLPPPKRSFPLISE
jgi:hypothetical protein